MQRYCVHVLTLTKLEKFSRLHGEVDADVARCMLLAVFVSSDDHYHQQHEQDGNTFFGGEV